jgi:hypothetical protein
LRAVSFVKIISFLGWAIQQPHRLIGDKAYDSDPLDEQMAAASIEMIGHTKTIAKGPKPNKADH